MSPAGGIWATAALRLVRKNLVHTTKMATKLLRSKLDAATNAAQLNITTRLQTVAVRRQPVHPAALLRQQKRGVHSTSAKWLSSATGFVRRHLSTSGQAVVRPRIDRSRLPVSNTSRAVAQLTGRAPFASTLRPNLTGGAIPRTAGGYTTTAGRGARYFSHAPACQAQVVQNVSQAMRAFWLSGQRARFDGVGPKGQKRYRAVTAAEEEARVKIECVRDRFAPGSVVDFRVSPTITALSALGSGAAVAVAAAPSLNAEGFLDVLSVDFARALKDLAAVMTDLKKLSSLGDLPISLEKGSVLRVRFPGVDAETVERLCDDMGVQRGVVREDADFLSSAGAAVALRFPFAPDAEGTITSPGGSLRSHGSEGSDELELGDAYFVEESVDNPWLESIADEDGYESMSPPIPYSSSGEHCSEEFEGLEGIYRFMEECDRARGQFQGRR